MKLTDNLYAYVWEGNDNNCNTYIFANVLSDSKHIIIDPGHVITPYLREPAYEILHKKIIKDGLRAEDIGLVIITHAHPDHFEASKIFKEKYRSFIALNKADEDIYQMFGGGKVDYYLNAGKLKLDNLIQTDLEVYLTPGHLPGHVSIYWLSKKALAVGDVIFYHNTGRVDLPGGDPGSLKRSLEILSKLDVEYLLCGHPYENPGVIQGKDAVKKNFEFVMRNVWF